MLRSSPCLHLEREQRRKENFKSRKEFTMAKRLYVGNLPYSTTDEDLKGMFAQAGAVESANVIADKFSGRSKGFGFVEMSADADAQKAIDMFNGQKMGDRTVVVNEARPMTERAPRGGGGGGYGDRGNY